MASVLSGCADRARRYAEFGGGVIAGIGRRFRLADRQPEHRAAIGGGPLAAPRRRRVHRPPEQVARLAKALLPQPDQAQAGNRVRVVRVAPQLSFEGAFGCARLPRLRSP